MTYSAAIRNSSSVADIPRFRRTGFRAARALEQRKILHVARADLDYVCVFFDEVERFVVNRFGDDAQAEFFANFGQDLQAGLAQPLKAYGRSARLVGAAAKKARARGLDATRQL